MLKKIKRGFRWLLRKRIRNSGILFTRDNIRIDREMEYGEDSVCVYLEVWFDAEKKFGLKLYEEEYINVYARIIPDIGEVSVTYVIYYNDGLIDDERNFTALTKDEKNLILIMANEVSRRETGLSVNANWEKILNDESFVSAASGR